jgi:DNA-binding CsgD family transcriptional regulator
LIVGRERERAVVDSFVASLGEGPCALLLEGEPGIGKTTLFRYALDAARARGARDVVVDPGEPDSALPFTGLGDLVEPLFPTYGSSLPEPQAKAVRVALLREDSRRPADRRALSAAVLALLRLGVDGGPLLVAIDDAQWLDADSATVIAFALRRLESEPVGALIAARADGSAAMLHRDLAEAFGRIEAVRLRVEPLAVNEIDLVITDQLQLSLPPRQLREVTRQAGGNPFIALELVHALERDEARPTGMTLPIPKGIRDDVVRRRLADLGTDTVEVLRVASALARPSVTTIRAVSPDVPLDEALDEGVAAGILHVRGDQVGFVHPLYSAAIYADLSRGRRHRLHASIAAVVGDPQERGRHLALASGNPDAGVAGEVEAAAGLARDRGAHDAAAELLDHAIRLTLPGDDESRIRRLLAATDERARIGEPATAAAHAAAAAELSDPGALRAEARWRVGSLTAVVGDVAAAERHLAAALDEPGTEDATRCRVHADLYRVERDLGRPEDAHRHATAALALADEATAIEVTAIGYGAAIEDSLFAGRGDERALLERDARVWEPIASLPVDRWPRVRLGEQRMLEGDLAGARDLLGDCLAAAGDEPVPGLLLSLAMLERLEGRFRDALGHAVDAAHAMAAWRTPSAELGIVAWLEAQLGLFDDARRHADEALAGAHDDVPAATVRGHEARAAIELVQGRRAEAYEHAVRAVEAVRAMGAGEPAHFPVIADAIDAMVAAGRSEEAASLIRSMERAARGRSRPYAKGIALRGKGLLAGATGDLEGAERTLGRAVREASAGPYEDARTLLVLGSVRRRLGAKRAAREALSEASRSFEQLAASPWAALAIGEAGRIGGRRPMKDLTDTEHRVARLAAAGRTNREIAATLFIAVRTVEGHVSRILRKLGLRNRTELALFFEELDEGPPTEHRPSDA